MKDLTAGEDRNDNVYEGTQQTKSPNYSWHLTVCPLYSALYAHPVKSMKCGKTIFMDLISHIKDLKCNDVCIWGTAVHLKNIMTHSSEKKCLSLVQRDI